MEKAVLKSLCLHIRQHRGEARNVQTEVRKEQLHHRLELGLRHRSKAKAARTIDLALGFQGVETHLYEKLHQIWQGPLFFNGGGPRAPFCEILEAPLKACEMESM